eukprot:CAMPEP_0175822472 /NCGR_PEP_ID=MMETSP0107_2-20121207/9697_1 /TAXON_ID=195067 ORGANISM="Goniomonas pacifica, Strain CCMP1869" /NCGR_SAMPLE_ID=MMETSP0107_2 /ASSEMBLY_ACC=CAM_ASM_000203 /LENGTH=532 /DNA_ID=CAMNT_0017134941 /DNA_START=1 /DNA_END=1599 /DNA_ORIENTATION=-
MKVLLPTLLAATVWRITASDLVRIPLRQVQDLPPRNRDHYALMAEAFPSLFPDPVKPSYPGQVPVGTQWLSEVVVNGATRHLLTDTGSSDLAVSITGVENEARPDIIVSSNGMTFVACDPANAAAWWCAPAGGAQYNCMTILDAVVGPGQYSKSTLDDCIQSQSQQCPLANFTCSTGVYGRPASQSCGVCNLYGDSSASIHGFDGIAVTSKVAIGKLSATAGIIGIQKYFCPGDCPDGGFTVAQGIIGMSYLLGSTFNHHPAYRQLLENAKTNLPPIFTMWLAPTGAQVSIGGVDPELIPNAQDIHYFPIAGSGPQGNAYMAYQIFLAGFSVNGQQFPMQQPVVSVMDSGTPFPMVLTQDTFDTLAQAMTSKGCFTQSEQGASIIVCPGPTSKFPTIAPMFVTTGPTVVPIEFTMTDTAYQYGSGQTGQVYAQTGPGIQTNIFGSPLLQNYVMVFDQENNQIGFAKPNGKRNNNGSGSGSSIVDKWYLWVPLIGGLLLVGAAVGFFVLRARSAHRDTEMRAPGGGTQYEAFR